ncbi:HAMP domain-containing sensor histidine kinase [Streptomyces sp. NPDC006923]|uniref:sensor histidine kinase n=1 Tax=Streptomyces sp. NPDC006923 TaxID=3155355 RepID=UPI00340DD4DD
MPVPAENPRLHRHSIRLRLTAHYSLLFSITGLLLLSLTNVLFRQRIGATTVTVVPKSELPSGGVSTLTPGQLAAVAERLRGNAQEQLLLMSLLALAVMLLVSVVLGWWIAGRVLRPLHTITATAQRLSAANLHERISLEGPDDELKDLADTLDALTDRLHAAFEAQRRFVANASHELRTPLAVQRATIQIRLGRAGLDDLPRIQDELLETNRRSERLIEGLLTLAASDRGLDRHEPIDVARVASEAFGQWRPAIKEAGLRAELDLRTMRVSGDPVLLFQLVSNLVQNAVRHNVPGGTLEVATSAEGGLVVRNTGAFVPRHEVQGLLEPFRRLTRTGDGVGLGLSIVHSIVQAHGGTIELDSRPGGGLEARVRLATTGAARPVPM